MSPGNYSRRAFLVTGSSWLALTALRAVLVWRFQRCAPAPPAIEWWGLLFGLGTFGAGLGWGSAGVWLFPVASSAHQVFLAFVLGGMLAGAVGLLSARMSVLLSFVCPAAVPKIVPGSACFSAKALILLPGLPWDYRRMMPRPVFGCTDVKCWNLFRWMTFFPAAIHFW